MVDPEPLPPVKALRELVNGIENYRRHLSPHPLEFPFEATFTAARASLLAAEESTPNDREVARYEKEARHHATIAIDAANETDAMRAIVARLESARDKAIGVLRNIDHTPAHRVDHARRILEAING